MLDTILGEAMPFEIKLVYDNGFEELFKFLVIQPKRLYLPTVMRNSMGRPTVGTMSPAAGTLGVAAVEGSAYAGSEAQQVWYRQLKGNEAPNDDWCPSGCGATAWSMLFGWIDRMANQQIYDNPDWRGRWGLFREDGGRFTPDAVAPKEFTGDGVKNMTWEIRNDILTACVEVFGIHVTDNAPTLPPLMARVKDYIRDRSGVSVTWDYELYDADDSLIKKAAKILGGNGGYVSTPAVIGVGYLEHYPLAFGWNGHPRTFCAWLWPPAGCVTLYYGEFLVNMGHATGQAEWYWDEDIWFLGSVQPNTAWQDSLGLYLGSPTNQWQYDYKHDGDFDRYTTQGWGAWYDLEPWPFGVAANHPVEMMNDLGFFLASTWEFDVGRDGTSSRMGNWGREGDLPIVGDFDRDGGMENLGFFRPSTQMWYYMVDGAPSTEYKRGPWGLDGDLPVAGDFDGDGFADDVAVYRPSTQMWYYDYDHNGTTNAGPIGPWGLPGDLPVAGDFDADGVMDDVALYRNAEHKWYFDHNHDGTTDSTAPWPWGDQYLMMQAKPFAGDFDGEGFVNDVGLMIYNRYWVIDYNHDGNFGGDETLPGTWGWHGEAPVRVFSLAYDRDGARDDIGYLQNHIWRFSTQYDHPAEAQSFNTYVAGSGFGEGVIVAESTDLPLTGDFDSDGFSDDLAFFRPSTQRWYYDYNHNGSIDESRGPWGLEGDRPVAGDFDRDGFEDDVAVYRPSDQKWRFDYDHDGTTDASNGPWGLAGDLPAAGDFDHDGYSDDLALFRPSTGYWYIDLDHDSMLGNSDLIVPGYPCPGCQPIVGAFGFR